MYKPPNNFKKGDQIIYVPSHVETPDGITKNDLAQNPECELGFVAQTPSPHSSHVRCRYWSKYGNCRDLRTRSNSEGTPLLCLWSYDTAPQEVVDAWLTIIDYEQGE